MKMSAPSPQISLLPMELPLMSSAGASHVKTLASPETAPESMLNDLACGPSFPVLLANFDRGMSLWKTSQTCLLALAKGQVGGLAEFSETWPRSGIMQNGTAFRLPPLARSMTGTAYGLLPTLTKCGNYNRKGTSKTSGDGLATVLKRLLPTLTKHDVRGGCKPERTERMWRDSSRGCDLPSTMRLLYPESTGIINPSWAEGFMGFPIGWTELDA